MAMECLSWGASEEPCVGFASIIRGSDTHFSSLFSPQGRSVKRTEPCKSLSTYTESPAASDECDSALQKATETTAGRSMKKRIHMR